ncbi:MAG: class I adenylate-forming enzyme family protein [Candidatus Nitrosopumilus sp. bin_68KS]
MNIINFLKNSVQQFPKKTALIFENNSFTFEELWNSVVLFSNSISTLNDKKIISLMAGNSPSFVISYLGIINSGKTVHIIPPEISESNLQAQINSSRSSAIICSNTVFNKISKFDSIKIPIFQFNEIPQNNYNPNTNLKTNNFAYLIYTSGTTSVPKGVGVTHAMVDFTTKNILQILKYTNSDIDILPLPLHHSFGLGCLHTSLCVGSTLILLKNTNDLQNILNLIKEHKATTLAAIPSTLTKFLKFNKNELINYFSNVRLVITNSTKIPLETIQDFKKILSNGNLATYYGLTEASRSTFMVFDKDSFFDESVGQPAPNVEIKIVNATKNNSEKGEIWIKGNNVIQTYWEKQFTDKNIVDGWLKTGDLGYIDNYGYLYLLGRNDDIINIGGEKVMPEEIESIVKKIDGVEDVAAFGIDNKIFGQVIKLHVVKTLNSDLDKSKILSHCIKYLEKYKIPTKIDFVANIPKTEYGKVKRFMLK